MPRRRPAAIRAAQAPTDRRKHAPPASIRGLSSTTAWAVHLAETASTDYYVYPGSTDRALRRYRYFLAPPGRRPLYPAPALCPCRGCGFDDVRHARDVLDTMIESLRGRARDELARVVARLDAEYLRRTLPNPNAARIRREYDTRWQGWWYDRISSPWGEPV